LGPFLLFCKAEMEKTQVPKGKEEVIKFGKDSGEQWKVLTADEKKVF